MRIQWLVLPTLLGACAMLQGPLRAVDTYISGDNLVVIASNGQICRAPWREGAGRMAACGVDWQVTPDLPPNLLRQVMEGATGAIGSQSLLDPMATITITGADGRAIVSHSPLLHDLNDE